MTTIKLRALLFEDAITPTEAIATDFALIALPNRFTLVSPRRAVAVVEKALKQYKQKPKTGPWPNIDIAEKLSDTAVVAYMSYGVSTDDLYQVSVSAAAPGYGPLIYDITMSAVYPAYLRSDSSLKEGSLKVWNRYYDRPDVEKKYLGNWSSEQVNEALSAVQYSSDGKTVTNVEKILWDNDKTNDPDITSESFLDQYNIQNRGPFYAYRKKSTDIGTYTELWRAGIELIDTVQAMLTTALGADEVEGNEATDMFRSASGAYFHRRYH